MLYRVLSWTSSLPIYPANILNLHKFYDQMRCMWVRFVVHYNEIRANFIPEKANMELKDIIPIPYTSHRASAEHME